MDLSLMGGGILIKTAGSLAGEITKRLVDAAGATIRKRYGVVPRKAALERAMTEALAGTISNLTQNEDLMEHYLGMFKEWMLRDRVVEELTQIIDPRVDTELDFQMLREEFEKAGYASDQLGEGVRFEDIIIHFIRAFRNAAGKESELQDEIKIDLLERLVYLTEQMLERVQHQPRADYKPDSFLDPASMRT